MKQKSLGLLCLVCASSVLAAPVTPPPSPLSPSGDSRDNPLFKRPSGHYLLAQTAQQSQPPVEGSITIDGTSPDGQQRTTVIDSGGNLKMINPDETPPVEPNPGSPEFEGPPPPVVEPPGQPGVPTDSPNALPPGQQPSGSQKNSSNTPPGTQSPDQNPSQASAR